MLNNHSINKPDRITPLDQNPDIEIFDPPLCCPTGLCGPSIDQVLLDVSEMVQALQNKGYNVQRYQMTTHPGMFTTNPAVMKLIGEKQMGALPITVVKGEIIAHGEYPNLEEIQKELTRDEKINGK